MWYKIAQSQKTIDDMRAKFEQAFPNNKPGALNKFKIPNLMMQSGAGAFGTPQTPGIKTELQTRPDFGENEFIPSPEEKDDFKTQLENIENPAQTTGQNDSSLDINQDDSVSAPPTKASPLEVKDPVTKQTIKLNPKGKFWTIQPGPITSKFGPRVAPTAGASTFHKGIDIAGEEGTPIIAAADGIVTVASSNSASGNYIIIDHGNGFQTSYSHLSAIKIRKGQFVKQLSIIGNMGSTGIATGPHLHFMVYKNGTPINPL